jgi:hypothetical protein
MPDGPFNSVILRAATRPSDVESAVSASADEGLHMCVFGSEAQAAHTKSAMPGTANWTRRLFERGEVLGPTNATAPETKGRQCFWGTSRTSAPRQGSIGKFAVSNEEVDRGGDHRDGDVRDVGVSAVRRRDDRRADPLGAPPRGRYVEFR